MKPSTVATQKFKGRRPPPENVLRCRDAVPLQRVSITQVLTTHWMPLTPYLVNQKSLSPTELLIIWVATISRLLKMIGLLCRTSSLL